MTFIEDLLEVKGEFIPKPGEGHNVVGVDTFEPPGEGLYLIGTYKTRKAALAAANARRKANRDEIVHVYSPGDG